MIPQPSKSHLEKKELEVIRDATVVAFPLQIVGWICGICDAHLEGAKNFGSKKR